MQGKDNKLLVELSKVMELALYRSSVISKLMKCKMLLH